MRGNFVLKPHYFHQYSQMVNLRMEKFISIIFDDTGCRNYSSVGINRDIRVFLFWSTWRLFLIANIHLCIFIYLFVPNIISAKHKRQFGTMLCPNFRLILSWNSILLDKKLSITYRHTNYISELKKILKYFHTYW